jgi:beta-lactamase class A
MNSYHFRNEKKYKRRRRLVTTTIILCLIAVAMGSYLFFSNRGPGSEPGDSTQTSSSNATSTETASNSSAVSNDIQQAADSTTPATPSPALNGVETKDHGFLPYVDSVYDSGKMAELEKLISDYISKLPGKYGVTFIDLATGETVEINDKVEYIAASTSKLPINVLLYKP